jgi:hypothetical protein
MIKYFFNILFIFFIEAKNELELIKSVKFWIENQLFLNVN